MSNNRTSKKRKPGNGNSTLFPPKIPKSEIPKQFRINNTPRYSTNNANPPCRSEHTNTVVLYIRKKREHVLRAIETQLKQALKNFNPNRNQTKIENAEFAGDAYITQATDKFDEFINRYLEGKATLEYEKHKEYAAILQQHATELQQLAANPHTDTQLDDMLKSHKKAIYDMENLYKNREESLIQSIAQEISAITSQFQGGRRKTRRKRHNKKTRRCKRH
jgi:paraquat-inducible protein B